MTWCRNGLNAKHDFCFMVNDVKLALNWWEVLACEFHEDFFDVLVKFEFAWS